MKISTVLLKLITLLTFSFVVPVVSLQAYLPLDRIEFKRIEKLVRLVIQAQLSGFTSEELNKIILKESNSELEVINIVEMIDFIKEKYPFKSNEMLTKIIETDDPSIDLYEIAREFLNKDKVVPEAYKRYYTTTDVFEKFKNNEKESTASLRENIIVNTER